MRDTIFQAIVNILKGLDCLKGSDGTVRVYPYERAIPEGYPAVNVVSTRLESSVLDNARDVRRYFYLIRVVQEKISESEGGFGPEKAERVARQREDEILRAFDQNNDLDVDGVIRTLPVSVDWRKHPSEPRIILDITLAVETVVPISM